MRLLRAALPPLVAALLAFGPGFASPRPHLPRPNTPPGQSPIQRVAGETYRLEGMLIDRSKREIRVPGLVNAATVLEYLANARDGFKAYESALELDASSESFNVALLMIGLESQRGVPSRFKFDPNLPQGDPVEIWVEWDAQGEARRVRAEEIVYDTEKKRTLATGPWVYTGSAVLPDGTYLARRDGVLIGFMHTPESIIDSPAALESDYGSFKLNPGLGLEPGTRITLILTALPRGK